MRLSLAVAVVGVALQTATNVTGPRGLLLIDLPESDIKAECLGRERHKHLIDFKQQSIIKSMEVVLYKGLFPPVFHHLETSRSSLFINLNKLALPPFGSPSCPSCASHLLPWP